ncbi:esterase FE4-like [Episyrphus balteatus]|uniref:esterase FE4-like n=1 Tax=Episyrphus balteatus TaxID=286459 RepID=UPI0024854BFB|nr:esterase FE4-like [Episyrphus balteatus]
MVPAFFGLFVISLCYFSAPTSAQSGPLVQTALGKVRGAVLKTQKGFDFYAFRGIRYAEAKRFEAPSFVTKWEEPELDGTKDGPICPQFLSPTQLFVPISEDCLFLNVYTRNLNKTTQNSVVVYIHGGANAFGSGHSLSGFGPLYLLENDIVLVTFNYRLGPFGFLSLNSTEAPGNYGYLDQVMVLEWIHHHIAEFGGNPESVTLFGMSAGGEAVSLHMASPLSKGLFHKAIAMSGAATSDIVEDSVKWTHKLAHETSCPVFNSEDVLGCLRKLPWETIVKVCETWKAFGFPNMKWGYQVDGNFMPARLTELFDQGNFTRIPLLTGLSKYEFTFSVYDQENNTGLFNDISLNFDKYAPDIFQHNFDSSKSLQTLRKFYLGNRTINDQKLEHFGEIFADSLIGHGVHRLVDLARKFIDVYYYRFDYVGRYGAYIDAEGSPRGASHADELLYLTNVETNFSPEDPDWPMVERMVGIISSFAQMGSPEDMNDIKWLPTNKTHLNTMYIDTNAELGYGPFTERFRLWDELFPVNSSKTVYASTLVVVLMILFQLFIELN